MRAFDLSTALGRHPQSFRYYYALVVGTFRTALDVGMLVVGSGLVGLAIAVLLDGFDLVSVGLDLSTAGMLGTALVIAVVGAFALGVASEGGYGAARRTEGFPSLEVAIGRLVFILVIALLLLSAASRIDPLVLDLTYPIRVANEVIRGVGSSGIFTAFVGVPFAWVLRQGLDRLDWGVQLEIPALYAIWAVAALVTFELPL